MSPWRENGDVSDCYSDLISHLIIFPLSMGEMKFHRLNDVSNNLLGGLQNVTMYLVRVYRR